MNFDYFYTYKKYHRLLDNIKWNNYSIFQLYIKLVDYSDVKKLTICSKLELLSHDLKITTALNSSISNGNIKIIDYLFDHMIKNDIKMECLDKSSLISYSVKQKSSYIFNYLLDKLKQLNLFKLDDFDWFKLLKKACSYENFEAVKTIINDFIIKKNSNNDQKSMKIDFTNEFISASLTQSKEICQFFIDSELYIDYDQLSSNSTKFSLINSEIFSMIQKFTSKK